MLFSVQIWIIVEITIPAWTVEPVWILNQMNIAVLAQMVTPERTVKLVILDIAHVLKQFLFRAML